MRRDRRRGYTLVELAVAAFAILLLAAAMARWSIAVSETTAGILEGGGDVAAAVASAQLQRDLLAAVSCRPDGTSAAVVELTSSRVRLFVADVADPSADPDLVVWDLSGDPASLRRGVVPASGEDPCDLALPASYGSFVPGLDAGSGFARLVSGEAEAYGSGGVCVFAHDEGCSGGTLRLSLLRDGAEVLVREFALP